MDSIISMVTLYDIISMTIPGALILSSLLLIVNDLTGIELINQSLFSNNAIIAVFIYIILSYSLGWINSQFAKYSRSSQLNKLISQIFKKHRLAKYSLSSQLNKLISQIFKKHRLAKYSLSSQLNKLISQIFKKHRSSKSSEDKLKKMYIQIFIAFFAISLVLDFALNLRLGTDARVFCFLGIIFIVLFPLNYKEDQNQYLVEESRKALNNYFVDGNFSVEDMSKMWVTCYALIQTDHKYNRIHNYNASKSFSKNLGSACLIVSFTSLYFMATADIKLLPLCAFIGVISAISAKLMEVRHRFFEKRVNELTAIYFIDYVKKKETTDDERSK